MAVSKKGRSCSFCGRTDKEVGFLITGIDGCICNECVERASEIVHDAKQGGPNPLSPWIPSPSPRRLSASLMTM